MTLLSGELRSLPPGLGIRILGALSLWTFAQATVRFISRFALGYRHCFALQATGRQLILEHEKRIFGRPVLRLRSVVPLDRIQELTWEKSGASPMFFVGLSALVLGTFVGARFLTEGLRAPGGAPWILSIGALLIILGIALDFFVGSGRTYDKPLRGHSEISVRVQGDKGWILSHLNETEALTLVQLVEQALATGQDLESARHFPDQEPADSAPVSAAEERPQPEERPEMVETSEPQL